MTQLRNDPDSITNYFDRVLAGIGHRGSSFTNIDRFEVKAMTHDGCSVPPRFLFQEFKRPGEECCHAQWWGLYDLAGQPNTDVWLVRQCEGLEAVEWIGFRPVAKDEVLIAETLSLEEYRQRFADWWNHRLATVLNIPKRINWAERVKHDLSLQAFIDAERAPDRLALEAIRTDRDHWKRVAELLYPPRRIAKARLEAYAELQARLFRFR